MIRFLNFITKTEKGIKIWSVIFGLIGTLVAIYMTYMFYSPQRTFIQNYLPALSVPIGFLCVYLLGVRKNLGNILGMIVNILESIVNLAFGNFGFVITAVYYETTHIFGYFSWKKNEDKHNSAIIRKMGTKRDKVILIAVLTMSTITVWLLYILKFISPEASVFLFAGNIISMYLGIVAQGTMVLRYRHAWIIFFCLNVVAIPIQFISGNVVYGVMYIFYQINVVITLYGQFSKQN